MLFAFCVVGEWVEPFCLFLFVEMGVGRGTLLQLITVRIDFSIVLFH